MTERKLEVTQADEATYKKILDRIDASDWQPDDAPSLELIAAHRIAERDAIVAWLREQGPATMDTLSDAIHEAYEWAADAIEKGDHNAI